jgi:phosphatidylserine/phosphatidylglycerophosphate/cardiolipin synthase-like enzyme
MLRRRKWSGIAIAGLWALTAILWGSTVGLKDSESSPVTSPEVLYAPEDRPADRLVALYEGARHSIYLASYGLTYPPIVRALIAAKKRGVDVRVITDREKLDDPKQRAALETLQLAGIPIRVNRHDGLMHLKQAVVDDRVNTSGSMNQTASAARYNDERLDILYDPVSTHRANEKFLKMWTDHSRYEDWR